MRLLVTSAFTREISKVLRSLGGQAPLRGLPFKASRCCRRSHELTFVGTGMGVEGAAPVFEQALHMTEPDAAISLGYCGGLVPGTSAGDLVWASTVYSVGDRGIDGVLHLPGHGTVFDTLAASVPLRRGAFLTLRRWMTKSELRSCVPADLPLPVCEMETFALARIALGKGVPFFAIRSVSDGDGDEVGFDPFVVCDASGTYRLSRSLPFFASHPRLIGRAVRLRRGSKVASRSLALAMRRMVEIL